MSYKPSPPCQEHPRARSGKERKRETRSQKGARLAQEAARERLEAEDQAPSSLLSKEEGGGTDQKHGDRAGDKPSCNGNAEQGTKSTCGFLECAAETSSSVADDDSAVNNNDDEQPRIPRRPSTTGRCGRRGVRVDGIRMWRVTFISQC